MLQRGSRPLKTSKRTNEAGLEAVTDLARREYPGDPTAEQRYRSHYIHQAGQQLHAEQVTNQAELEYRQRNPERS